MAEVWEGRDEVLGRPVAVKVLQSHLSGDATFVERFRREAVTAAAMSSPTIVATYDAGVDSGTAFIVMELVRGRTLRQLLDGSGALQIGLAVEIAAQVADALGRAHRAGLVHRDVKPANVLVADDEDGTLRAKVTDFGIAKARAGLDSDLTQTGTVLGTPKYLSPEQVQGREDLDERSDLYSLGVVIFEMLTGRVPFDAPADMTVALAHLEEVPPRVRQLRSAVPRRLDELVSRLLAKDRADRPASAAEVRRELLAICSASAARTDAGRGGSKNDAVRRSTLRTADPAGRSAPSTAVDSGPNAASGPAGTQWSPEGRRPSREAIPGNAGGGCRRTTGFEHGRSRRRLSGAGVAVAAVAVAAVVVGSLLMVGSSPESRSTSGKAVAIRSVKVYLDVTGYPPDDPEGTPLTFDGNPNKKWWTEQYLGPDRSHFGGLYGGEGLAIKLAGPARLSSLKVTSSTVGWAASTYVSDHPVGLGQPLSDWGPPVSERSNIDGSTTFDLLGRRGSWVLLWLTDLGPAGRANVAELSVRGSAGPRG
jgi:serine/threonine-protein kinase